MFRQVNGVPRRVQIDRQGFFDLPSNPLHIDRALPIPLTCSLEDRADGLQHVHFLGADLGRRYDVDPFTNMGLSQWPSAAMSASASFGPQLPRL